MISSKLMNSLRRGVKHLKELGNMNLILGSLLIKFLDSWISKHVIWLVVVLACFNPVLSESIT